VKVTLGRQVVSERSGDGFPAAGMDGIRYVDSRQSIAYPPLAETSSLMADYVGEQVLLNRLSCVASWLVDLFRTRPPRLHSGVYTRLNSAHLNSRGRH
jgi:hypothetical protein